MIGQVNRRTVMPLLLRFCYSRARADTFLHFGDRADRPRVCIRSGMASAWFRLVRQRLASHAGFYAPTTALICPCKGNERGLEENLLALTRFDYPNYEIYFTLATSLDPALKVIERVKAASQRPVHIVIAGPPTDCERKSLQPAARRGSLARRQIRNARVHGFRRALAARLAHQADCAAAGRRASAPPPRIAGLSPAGREWNRVPSCFASAWNARGRDDARQTHRKFLLGRRHGDSAKDF